MFIGHAPAGYLFTRALVREEPDDRRRRFLIGLGVLASVAPDLDLLWFYTLGERARVHHAYWPHLPWTWLLVLAVWVTAALVLRRRAWVLPGLIVGLGGLLHLALDSLTGGIRWLHPWTSDWYRLIEVPPAHDWWVWNFVLHWTMALELALLAAACWIAKGVRPHCQSGKRV